jgi:acylphosphatase
MSTDTIRRRLVVYGRVQGVFFRDATREAAVGEGVAGWIANRGDGAVEAVLEGPRHAVDTVTEFCRQGPARARVERVEQHSESPEGLTGFEIR